MALGDKGESAIYLSVSDGSIVRSFKTPTEGATPRTNKKGNTVYELHYRFVEGMLVAAKTRKHDFGKDWVFTIEDGGERYQLTIPYSSRYSTSMLKAFPNLDLSKPVRIMPWSMADSKDATKKVTGITMYQDGKKLEPYYTKDNPNGLPEMKKVRLKGEMVWDSTDMDEFLEIMVLDRFGANASDADDERAGERDEALV